jgi:hypothetical protein
MTDMKAIRSRYAEKLDTAAQTLNTALLWLKTKRMAPPPGATTEMGRLLWAAPQPLINPGAKMMVVFSQKAACTNVLIWFFHHLGHATAARHFHNWPHEYRNQVYYYSALYRKAYGLDFEKFKAVRVVRDPYERAASSFRHVVRNGFADATIAKRLRYRHIASKGLSFSAFLDFLDTLDLTDCDPHYSLQRHPIEDRLPVHHLINISTENLFTRLSEVETALGLPQSDMAGHPWVKRLRQHNRPAKELAGGADLYAQTFTREQARLGPWPRDEALLTPRARERIARLYAVDISAYLRPFGSGASLTPAIDAAGPTAQLAIQPATN